MSRTLFRATVIYTDGTTANSQLVTSDKLMQSVEDIINNHLLTPMAMQALVITPVDREG